MATTAANTRGATQKSAYGIPEFVSEVEKGGVNCGMSISVDTDDIRIMHRHSGKRLSIRYEGVLDAEPSVVCASLREWDLISSWNSGITRSDILKKGSMLSTALTVYGEVWAPWPFTNRRLIVKTQAFEMLKTKGAIAIMITPAKVAAYGEGVQKGPGGNRTKPCNLRGGVMLSPVRQKGQQGVRSKTVLILHLYDKRLELVPKWLLRVMMSVYGPGMIGSSQSLVRAVSSHLRTLRMRRQKKKKSSSSTSAMMASARRRSASEEADGAGDKYTALAPVFAKRILSSSNFYENFLRRRVQKYLNTAADASKSSAGSSSAATMHAGGGGNNCSVAPSPPPPLPPFTHSGSSTAAAAATADSTADSTTTATAAAASAAPPPAQ